ncbi:cytochrome P450 monooxygenase pc-3 [Suillus paluster]|uniref:cytochrome P450 monooxygenase pc-3 n=1 Tax=Suillus paluster TaxID=48578 RepID=UPI001B87826E|nr:cytochrome P450 monooxygenase pc-3 [Suillus paluster]KAG1731966.1 cytochrome P450 monooxygenase pc-3 [Suillus paluster]
MEVPPGFIFLTQIIPRAVLLPAVAFGASGLVLGDAIPRWLRISASLLAPHVAVYLKTIVDGYSNQRKAKARGAVLPPRVQNRWPAGIDLLVELLDNLKHGYMGETQERLCQEYGYTIRLRMLFEDKVLTAEPEHIKAILSTKFNSFGKGAYIEFITRPPIDLTTHGVKGPYPGIQFQSLLGTGVFNADGGHNYKSVFALAQSSMTGDAWKFHRSMTRPFFSKDRVSDFDIFEKHADDAIRQIKIRLREGYPVDFQDMISRFTMDSATEFLLRKGWLIYPSSSPLSKDPAILRHPANQFAHAFHEAQVSTIPRGHVGALWRMIELFGDKVKKHMKKAASNSGSLIGSAQDKDVQEGNTLLDHLVNCSEDHVLIRDETINILLAGRDTTATTLTFVIYMLSQHPQVMHRLREEILNKIGPSKRPTHEDMRDLRYMRAVINETLRLYPPVTSREATVLPAVNGGDPMFIPADTLVMYSVFVMHRRKDLWGPDALEFDPDRFLDERLQKYLTPNPFIFLAFNAGPRICPGQQFAYNEMSFFLVRLLQSFSSVSLDLKLQTLPPTEWANEPGRKGADKVVFKAHLTTYVQDGLWVRMEEGPLA